jgi:predicted GNAT family N-acyltransferase
LVYSISGLARGDCGQDVRIWIPGWERLKWPCAPTKRLSGLAQLRSALSLKLLRSSKHLEVSMENIELKTILHNSPEYQAEVTLRSSILRQPLGLSLSTDELSAEAGSHHIGCYIDGQLIGCLVLKPIDGKQVQMRQVAVDEKFKGRGIGRVMVKYSEDFARKLGYREMVLDARETAVPFYELLGYTKVGDRFTEVTIPHWVMVRAL